MLQDIFSFCLKLYECFDDYLDDMSDEVIVTQIYSTPVSDWCDCGWMDGTCRSKDKSINLHTTEFLNSLIKYLTKPFSIPTLVI